MYTSFHLLSGAPLWCHRLPNNGVLPPWEQFVLLIAARLRPQFTGQPHNTLALDSDASAREGTDDRSVLFKAIGKDDNTLHVENGSGKRYTDNDSILTVGEGDDALPMDDDSGTLHEDEDSNVLSDGDDTTVLVIGEIKAGSDLDTGDILAAIYSGGDTAILDVGALHVGDNVSILDAGDLGIGADARVTVVKCWPSKKAATS
jgi:hypothetical protein